MKKLLFAVLFLTGCASASVKRDIANDLTRIIQEQSCLDACEKIKAYISEKLGGVIPIPNPPDKESAK